MQETDPLGSGLGSTGIREAHFANRCINGIVTHRWKMGVQGETPP